MIKIHIIFDIHIFVKLLSEVSKYLLTHLHILYVCYIEY